MGIRFYIWATRFLTFVFLVAFVFVITYIDPEISGIWGKIIFYASFFLAVSGLLNLFLLFVRRKMMDEEMAAANAALSFRQGVLLAMLAIGLLILQSFRMLVWWDGLLVAAGIFLIELYFLSRN